MNSVQRGAGPILVVVVLVPGAGFLVGWFLGNHSRHDWLLSYAGICELFGVLLVAAPELVPILRGIGSAIATGWRHVCALLRSAIQVIRRRLGGPRHQVVSVEAADSVAASGSVSAVVSVDPTATVEAQVAFLLRRDQAVQGQLNTMAETLERLPDRWRTDIHAATADLRAEQSEGLEQLRRQHLRVRLLGVGLLAVGVALGTAGNLA
jgi:hypothetical protein